MTDIKEALGIPIFGPWYVQFIEGQDYKQEYNDVLDFVKSVVNNKDIEEFNSDNIDLQFINYGRTQLVFVVTVDNSKQYTLLVNQPATKYGVGKTEYDNLIKLNQVNSNLVIKPMYYYEDGKHELYITPYYHQARCVGVNTSDWGVWIPEPDYHFANFTENDHKIINSSIVANLIKLYDEEDNKGIAKCRLDGGDFMLLKGYENHVVTYDDINDYLKLIAARELISISLDEYIDRIKYELTNPDISKEELVVIGKKLRRIMNSDEVDKGIELGLSLKKQKVVVL